MRWMVMAAVLMLLGGCVRSLQPVLTDDQVTMDRSLAGQWVSEDGKQSFKATPAADGKRYDVVYTDEHGKVGRFAVRLGRVGELTIAEVSPGQLPEEVSEIYQAHLLPLYSFLLLQKTPTGLNVATMSQEWLLKYLEAHPGELQIAGQDKDRTIVISPTADLQQFILHHWQDEDAMGKPALFVHPGEPTTRAAN